ncbi:hypothetical protein [Variovorax sp. E3]|uniref:hypothetical protein n=1 Tax=Variovorax sp. E3 TaxID=1914993 RepID=UPI0018DB1FC9|nr:hypothetical protein [Variovorax sp. E3]
MGIRIALTAGLCMAAATAAIAFEAAGIDMPALVRHPHRPEAAQGTPGNMRGVTCKEVRARKPAELPSPWRGAVTAISMSCEPFPGLDKEPDVSTDAVARLRPGAATLWGVPVIELRHSESWAHGDSQYVLGAAYADVAASLGAYLQARCLSQAPRAAPRESICNVEPDARHGGLYVRTSELGGVWLHPDPADPRRSILAQAWSE